MRKEITTTIDIMSYSKKASTLEKPKPNQLIEIKEKNDFIAFYNNGMITI
ncbi:MAG: hypothetical protein HRT68_04230 [Flavobacteriaceae bacterium]|nr:hypothetical protein [Flavobacteriaceae bacterium]